MNLMIPVNSLESCKAQIDSGADEIYVGYKADLFTKVSFSGRHQISYEDKSITPDKDEFANIVRLANEKNVKVSLTANREFFSNYSVHELDFEEAFRQYILYAIDCGIESVIISDLGLIDYVNGLGLPVNIHSSTILDTDNMYQINFLKENGVSRVVLSYQITYEEILKICSDKTTEIEVFGYGGCSFGCYCALGHGDMRGIPCLNSYCTDDSSKPLKLINSIRSCSICSLWKLMNLNVDVIKLTGRERKYTEVISLTKLFREAIDIASISPSHEKYVEKIQSVVPYWWKRAICKQNHCKYELRPANRYSINISGSN